VTWLLLISTHHTLTPHGRCIGLKTDNVSAIDSAWHDYHSPPRHCSLQARLEWTATLSRLPGPRTVRSVQDRSPARSLSKWLFSDCGLLVFEPVYVRSTGRKSIRAHTLRWQGQDSSPRKVPLRKLHHPAVVAPVTTNCPIFSCSDRSMGSKEHSESGFMQEWLQSELLRVSE
jgi:hypothetical protein